jgi:hypothetical protein
LGRWGKRPATCRKRRRFGWMRLPTLLTLLLLQHVRRQLSPASATGGGSGAKVWWRWPIVHDDARTATPRGRFRLIHARTTRRRRRRKGRMCRTRRSHRRATSLRFGSMRGHVRRTFRRSSFARAEDRRRFGGRRRRRTSALRAPGRFESPDPLVEQRLSVSGSRRSARPRAIIVVSESLLPLGRHDHLTGRQRLLPQGEFSRSRFSQLVVAGHGLRRRIRLSLLDLVLRAISKLDRRVQEVALVLFVWKRSA